MKTVIDAVNEYEAIPPKPCYMENKEQIIMAKKPFEGYLTGDLTTGDGVRDNEYWKVICTREEFNQCVDEMSKAEWIKPVTVPTFTELPKHPIGTKVNLVEDTGFYSANRDTIFTATPEDEVEVIGYCNHPLSGNECVTLYFEPYGFSTINPEYIQPLTPPIELIDGKAYQFEYKGDKYTGIYSDIDYNHKADVFIIIDGHVMASYCKSIQLLEVAK